MLEYAGRSNLKRVYNELGGKSAFVVFDDFADLERAATTVAGSMFFNQGESCNAPSRVLVHESVADEFVAHRRRRRRRSTSRPTRWTPARVMGALVDETQLQHRDAATSTPASAEGARCVAGGRQVRAETGGYYVEPTVFDGVTQRA